MTKSTRKTATITDELRETLEKRIVELTDRLADTKSRLAASEMALANERFLAETAVQPEPVDPKAVENLLIGEYLDGQAGAIDSRRLEDVRTGLRLAIAGLL